MLLLAFIPSHLKVQNLIVTHRLYQDRRQDRKVSVCVFVGVCVRECERERLIDL